MSAQLNNICIILVNPSHAGNIGGVARAMKNMGLSQLRLVDPADHLSLEASARAAGAIDILKSAQVYPVLGDALKDCHFVVGASARPRSVVWPTLTASEAAGMLCEKSTESPVALVFGREQSGLSNGELDQCHFVSTIDASREYSSLNLASAVQIFAYLIYRHFLQQTPHEEIGIDAEKSEKLAAHEDLRHFYEHLETTLCEIGFLNPKHPRKLMRKLQRLFNRTLLEENELNMLRGILTAVDGATENKRTKKG